MSEVKVDEIFQVLKGLEIAINKKMFTKEELDVFFPSWNNLVSVIDKIKRQDLINQLYKAEPVQPTEPEVKPVEPGSKISI
jgi:hypothetical protein